jgi:transcriptional regulator with XRE-family HTH domain
MRAPRARFNVERIVVDMADRGWNAAELARQAGLGENTVSRFLRGEIQSPGSAAKIARALGYATPRRYLAGVETAA